MSQDNKGRTMIGTLAPGVHPPGVHPRPPTAAGPDQATIVPVRPSSTTAQTIVAQRSATSSAQIPTPTAHPRPTGPQPAQATVAMRPRNESVPPMAPMPPVMPAYDADPFIGQELCGYTIRRKLAEGGMGVVYEGEHQKIGRLGAIKVLKPEFCRSEDVVERFHQEARAVNAIRHENIVDIYDFGRDAQGRVFFVMEYLEGEPLAVRIRRGALTWPEAFPILEQTLRALKAAHDKGFVHRDLKPDNIWLRYVEGRVQVKLLDFGIAKLVGAESPREKLTQTGSVIGTPHYMSPEQINGSKDIDQRTDLYALGVITYEMFAGVTPFVGDTLQAVMTGHLFKEPPRLADIPQNLGVPAQIAEIIDRMLVKDVAGRYESVGEVLDDLYDVNGNRWPTHAGTLNRLRPTRGPTQLMNPMNAVNVAPPPAQRRSGRGAVIGLLAVAGLGAGGFAVWKSQQPPAETPVAVVAPTKPAPEKPVVATPPPAPVIDEEAVRTNAQTVLRASLREGEPKVRVQGSDAIGAIKDQHSEPELTRMTESDADDEVRGHTAGALGALGATATASLLAKLEATAAPPLKVWYASALARLGDKAAIKRLRGHAASKDLAVAFKATLDLAELSQPGDKQTLAALRALAAHEAELNQVQPYAGALILTKMAALRDEKARELLHATLKAPDEGSRLAAAEGLAKLGDDAGRAVLHATAADPSSPNRLVAASAQIALGEYGGLEVITQALAAKDPATKRIAARALGDIGEKKSLPALIALAGDKDWTVRIAVARALVGIVGIDPLVLAQASVDWTRSALASEDWATRKAAAGVLADMPEAQVAPLLAQAIADKNPEVRLAASKSAGRIKTAETAGKVVAAVATEQDPKVKEQQVKALGEIGKVAGPAARDALAALSEGPGRLGVLAAGSLISVGDETGKAKLEAAVAPSSQPELRMAAVEAASATNNPVVVPTLKIGLFDKVDRIKFLAAEGLSTMKAEKAAAEPVLTAALTSKDADIAGRAMAALARFGVPITNAALTPAQMIDSPDRKQRLAAVPIVRALPPGEGVPLLRRLIVDPDIEVRYAGVDAIQDLVVQDKEAAKKLYKPLVKDADPIVRSKAAGQLSRLVEAAPVPPPPVITADKSADPAVDDPLPKLQTTLAEATTKATAAKEAFDQVAAELTTALAATSPDDKALDEVRALITKLDTAAKQLDTTASEVETAAGSMAGAGGASPAAAQVVSDAQALATRTRGDARAVRDKLPGLTQKAKSFIDVNDDNVQSRIALAETAIRAGKYGEAQRYLDAATKKVPRGTRLASLDFTYGLLYQGKLEATSDPAARAKLAQQAIAAYDNVVRAGAKGGGLVAKAKQRKIEVAEDAQAPQ